MNKVRALGIAFAACCLSFSLSSCQFEQPKTADFSNAQEVAKLATLECSYHNVVKIERDADWRFFALNPGQKQEWFEYSVIVSFGIDASKVEVSEPDASGSVTISIPQGQVLSEPNIQADTMTDPVDANGTFTEVTDDDRKKALTKAQQETLERACSDDTLLAAARDRAKTLLEQYVKNVGNAMGETYTVKFVDVE